MVDQLLMTPRVGRAGDEDKFTAWRLPARCIRKAIAFRDPADVAVA
jgi:hypothetical protein